jgi:hypothetical protein
VQLPYGDESLDVLDPVTALVRGRPMVQVQGEPAFPRSQDVCRHAHDGGCFADAERTWVIGVVGVWGAAVAGGFHQLD